ncbi:GNAT family N-acetyltransferase [Rhodocaloribacter litoris]|uniref:GNAT family N-acetyltransferase n=1 Tax=Rhodocaloribacter litoris TaxID=2558931 RepID=UPI00142232D2|nr:GNAT family N-acetyltransferase [Rhodocaloribacter litoris]QXD14648.1 GNAT family N-acetyltransferase [Rhodocaloribacter litoris]GIV59578.1 MAG: hypothetical protein KatS3mg043_0667 [Rhodothermaceae bacterium]
MHDRTGEVAIRLLEEPDLQEAFDVLRRLRTHLTWELFRERLDRQRRVQGYRLVGAFASGKVVGVLGMRPVETMARGPHLHVDDLVVAEHVRGRGIGRSLLAYAEQFARRHGLGAVFLDSRPEALPFYVALGYRHHTATLMRKALDDAGIDGPGLSPGG